MPSYTDPIVQLFSGMVQITKSQSVIGYVGDRMPLETLLPVTLPIDQPVSTIPGYRVRKKKVWSTDLLLVRYAEEMGYITAKAGTFLHPSIGGVMLIGE